jgi:hypothetical protein
MHLCLVLSRLFLRYPSVAMICKIAQKDGMKTFFLKRPANLWVLRTKKKWYEIRAVWQVGTRSDVSAKHAISRENGRICRGTIIRSAPRCSKFLRGDAQGEEKF